MNKETLIPQLQNQIVDYLNLEEIQPDEIDPNESLFGDDIGLDSIDALELIVLMQNEYNIQIEDPKEGREILNTVNSMADHIIKMKG